ncbi:DgyrCDS3461 [Dimorphilus gyrociliatus]|uniref:Hydroxysteroid dehydrogenase-like protein 2 n=1 Tax=Dimorphilus gyrociliatus TaxID=2664684 RepID=A0A7I8VD84_9ANNE|nr:DgyrCDS3461 [Dimorphilus gyrociliatus]
MAANTGALAGRTIFITGASRGIGKAIALKCARDGANIVIAAKTAEPHPKLPGTIFSAAKEIEEAGGKALPCVVDIRDEKAVNTAVEQAASTFGGIDVLVNNASAISLTGTEATDMKKYDLMNGINARGTYLCSRACLPFLKKGTNAHILNISPPLNMKPRWFQNHVAYTMAKYGMSMCALGMAEEFKPHKIAVNALWPRTAIYTAAMEMIGGGAGIKDDCRKVDIMSDAAYIILSKSTDHTGNFYIDDDVLKESGVTDLSQYAFKKDAKLLVDFFLDDFGTALSNESEAPVSQSSEPASSSSGGANSEVGKTFEVVKSLLNDDLVSKVQGVYQFDIKGKEEGKWWLDLKNGSGSIGQGDCPGDSGVTLTLKSDDFVKMFRGKLKPTMAFMSGKLKIKGDMALAMKLEKLMKQLPSKL